MVSVFKTIGKFSLLCIITLTAPYTYAQTVQFEKQKVASESYEAVAAVDVNGNGHLDLISGEYGMKVPISGPGILSARSNGAVNTGMILQRLQWM
jgi:hypothetical protein